MPPSWVTPSSASAANDSRRRCRITGFASATIADARAVLAEGDDTAYSGFLEVEQVSFLGRGWTVGLANEAALKLRESVQFWAEAYPAMEYRHGPISIAAGL